MTYPKITKGDTAPAVHPAVRDALRCFDVDHLPADLKAVAQPFRDLALMMAEELPSDSQVTLALHHLTAAKDCAVRAVVFNREAA